MNKFSGERVYEDPTKDKKSLEEKNQAKTEILDLTSVTIALFPLHDLILL